MIVKCNIILCICPFDLWLFPSFSCNFLHFPLLVKGLWKHFVHPFHLAVLPLQYKGRTHDGSIRLGEHAVLLEASKPLLSPVPNQREVPGLTQVSLAAGGDELGGVVVGNKGVLKMVRYWQSLIGIEWPDTSLAPGTTSAWDPPGSRCVTGLPAWHLQPQFAI